MTGPEGMSTLRVVTFLKNGSESVFVVPAIASLSMGGVGSIDSLTIGSMANFGNYNLDRPFAGSARLPLSAGEAGKSKLHLVNDAVAYGVKLEMERATPIRPLRAVVLQYPAAQANDEWEFIHAPLSLE